MSFLKKLIKKADHFVFNKVSNPAFIPVKTVFLSRYLSANNYTPDRVLIRE